MNASCRQFNRPAAVLLVMMTVVVGYSTHAYRSVVLAAPTAVATVDLDRVFRGMVERGVRDAATMKIAEDLDTRAEGKRGEIDLLREDLDLYAPGSAKFETTSIEIGELTYKLQAFIDWGVRILDADKSKTLRESYDHIKQSAAKMATALGYDLVIVDDSAVPVPSGVTEGEAMRQISARRILYTNPEIDITDALITDMNARFEAQQAKGG